LTFAQNDESGTWAGDVGLEVMWFGIKQDLPCNNAGNAAPAVCGARPRYPNVLCKDSSNVAYRATFTKKY
jgi:hypothetical protein